MNKDITLLILAAGMGSRYGGLKQIEPVGPNGEFIIDYSIYDAIKAGFTKVVFVIKKENEQVFKETVGRRIEKHIKVEYAYQDILNIPEGFPFPEGRTKPWGTSHAIMAAENQIKEPFAIINADDFYGRDAYIKMAEFLKQNKEDHHYCLIGYPVENTLSLNGAVKRGVCKCNGKYLSELIESNVSLEEGKIIARPLNGESSFPISQKTFVSMNMLGFTPSLFPYLKKNFSPFLEKNIEKILTCEYLIPDSMYSAILDNYAKVSVIPTTATWQGITYKEDMPRLIEFIQTLIKEGKYPTSLWK